VSPKLAGNAGYATLVVDGAKFVEGSTLRLEKAGSPDVVPAQLRVISSTRMVAIFDLKGKAAGNYDIVVTKPDNQSTTLQDGFEIVSGGGAAEPRITINGPGWSRGETTSISSRSSS
jgi:hypothetical protein